MGRDGMLTRRGFIRAAALGAAAAITSDGGAQSAAPAGRRIPLKIGIRAASMKMVGDFDVVRTAAGIPGISGVELQVMSGTTNLGNPEAVLRYKREADRWAMRIPSLAGVWDRGVTIRSASAGDHVRRAIRAAETLGSGAILLAFFKDDAPDMAREESFGPIVAMLRDTAKSAADAGVVLGLENSLSPADNKKLVDLVGHPSVGVYYDMHNMATYGHGDQAIPGVKLLGTARICAVHVKNGDKLIEEAGPVDWTAALGELSAIGYSGWYIYETSHAGIADCIEDTRRNNAFLRAHAEPPVM